MNINWHEIPFIRMLLPFLIGIMVAINVDTAGYNLLYLLPLLFLLLLLFHFNKSFINRPFYGMIMSVFLFCFGNTIVHLNNELNNKNHFSNYVSEFNFIEGKLINEPVFNKSIKCEVELNKIGINQDTLFNCNGKAIIYLNKDLISSELKYGDLIIAKIKLNKIDPPKNPYAFNYKSYLKYKNISYQGYLQQYACKLIKKDQGNILFNYSIKSRNYFISILNTYITGNNERAVANALILGNKTALNTDLKNAYSGTGAIHVLAVSGLHVGIILIILNFFFQFIPKNIKAFKLIKTILILLGIWSFALITGAAPSVIRAATMLSIVTIGAQLKRQPNIYNTIAAAAFIMLLWDPYQVVDVGFQLSFLALIGIIYFQPIIYKSWYIENRFFDSIWKLAAVAIAAQVTTLPISFYYFHQFPVYFLLSGIIVIPAAVAILWLGILLFIFSKITPLAILIGKILEGIIWLTNAFIFSLTQLPGSLIKGIWIGLGAVVLLYIMIAFYIYAREADKKRWVSYAAGLFLIFSLSTSFTSLQNAQQTKIEIYHSRKNTIIDLFDGKNLVTLTNPKIEEDAVKFATQNNRWSTGITNQEDYHLDTPFETESILYQNNFLNFKNKTIFIPPKNAMLTSDTLIKVNYVLLTNNSWIKPAQLFEVIQADQIIIDASNHKWTIEKWEKYLAEHEIPVYNIVEEGAFMIETD